MNIAPPPWSSSLGSAQHTIDGLTWYAHLASPIHDAEVHYVVGNASSFTGRVRLHALVVWTRMPEEEIRDACHRAIAHAAERGPIWLHVECGCGGFACRTRCVEHEDCEMSHALGVLCFADRHRTKPGFSPGRHHPIR